jgi:hypothetical protein
MMDGRDWEKREDPQGPIVIVDFSTLEELLSSIAILKFDAKEP